MQMQEIVTLYDYTYWANGRILDAAGQLNAELFVAPTTHTYGSLRGTLVHTLSAEWVWRSRWQGTSPTAMLPETDFPTLAAVVERWHEEETQMRAFLNSLQEADLGQEFHYQSISGKPQTNLLWQAMMHLVLHGMQHRSEAAAILTDVGQSPGDIDFIMYLRG